MKTLTFIAAMLLVASNAFAGATLDLRADYLRQATDQPAARVTKSNFNLNRSRLRMGGNFNESISFDSRFKLDVAALDYAQFVHKMGNVSVTMGVLADTLKSAWEGQTTAADQYVTSNTYNYSTALGAKVEYTLDTHVFALVAYETGATISTGTYAGSSADRQALGLGYKGYLMDKNLGLIFNYNNEPLNEVMDKDVTYMALGAFYKMNALYAEFDYLSKVEKQAGTVVAPATIGNDKKSSSIVLNFKYDLVNYIPFFKYTMDTVTDVGDSKMNKMALGCEFKMKQDEAFRYHVAYASEASTPYAVANATTTTNTSLYLGARIVADILK